MEMHRGVSSEPDEDDETIAWYQYDFSLTMLQQTFCDSNNFFVLFVCVNCFLAVLQFVEAFSLDLLVEINRTTNTCNNSSDAHNNKIAAVVVITLMMTIITCWE